MASQSKSSPQPSLRPRRWSLISKKRSRKRDTNASTTDNCSPPPSRDLPPVAIWTSHVLPYLERRSQDALVQVHKEVWLDRSPRHTGWPTGRIVPKLSGRVQSVAFVGSSPEEKLWVVAHGQQVTQFDKLKGPVSSDRLVSHPDETIVATRPSPVDPTLVATLGNTDGSLGLWKQQRDGWTRVRTWAQGSPNLTQRHLVWAPTGDRIATWGPEGVLRVVFLEPQHQESLRIDWFNDVSVGGCLQTIAFTPNGRHLLHAFNNATVHEWNLASNTIRANVLPELRQEDVPYWNEGGAFVSGLTFAPDGKSLVVGCQVALLKIWTVREKEDSSYEYTFCRKIVLGSLFGIRNQWSPHNLTFHPGSRYVACTNFKGPQVRIVDLESKKKKVKTWRAAAFGRVESLSFSPDGNTLATGINRTVNLWAVGDLFYSFEDEEELGSANQIQKIGASLRRQYRE